MQYVYVRGNKIVKRKPSTSSNRPRLLSFVYYTFAPYLPSFSLHDIKDMKTRRERKKFYSI